MKRSEEGSGSEISPAGWCENVRRGSSPTACTLNSVFRRSLRGSARIFRIQAGCCHDGASQFFGGKDGPARGRGAAGVLFFGMGSDETIAPAYNRLQVLRFAGIIRQSAANFPD